MTVEQALRAQLEASQEAEKLVQAAVGTEWSVLSVEEELGYLMVVLGPTTENLDGLTPDDIEHIRKAVSAERVWVDTLDDELVVCCTYGDADQARAS